MIIQKKETPAKICMKLVRKIKLHIWIDDLNFKSILIFEKKIPDPIKLVCMHL